MRRLAAAASLVSMAALIADAAVETFLAGSPSRWVVGGIALACLAAVVLLRRSASTERLLPLPLLAFFAIIVVSAWWPGGLDAGVVVLRQPSRVVLPVITGLAILAAGWTVARTAFLPLAVRALAAAVAAYGLAGVAIAWTEGTSYGALLHGGGLWTRLPFWLQGAFLGSLVLVPAACLLQVGMAALKRQAGSGAGRWLRATAFACVAAVATAGVLSHPGTTQDAVMVRGQGGNGPGLKSVSLAALAVPVPRTMDLAYVEPRHFAAALGNDPVRAFEFVRDQVAYEPYRGALRGPRGTLLALAGNSVDRAWLLAALLASGNHRVRFVHGQLPETLATQLVASVFEERPENSGAHPPESDAARLAVERLSAGMERDGALLTASLKATGLPARAAVPSLQSLVEESRDHYWVQLWRDGAWVDMDPTFATAAAGQVFGQPLETTDALPDALFHRVDVSVKVEEYDGDRASTREVLHYRARAADLSGTDLVLVHAPAREVGQVKPALIVDGQREEGTAFSVAPAPRSTKVGFESLFGGGSEEPEAAVALAASEVVQVTFSAAGGRTEAVTREIFDLVGPATRLKAESVRAETARKAARAAAVEATTNSVYDLFVTTGAVHAGHLEKVEIPATATAGALLDVRAALRRANVLFAATSDRLLQRVATKDGAVYRFYPDAPRLQIMQFTVGRNDVRVSMDLRRDTVRVVGSRVRKEQLFGAQVMRGVAQGQLERLFAEFLSTPDVAGSAPQPLAMSTSLVFERAAQAKVPTALLDGHARALSASVPGDARARLEHALGEGWVAFAPTGPVDLGGARRFAWWQIDRQSGATIPVTDAGLHQATVELSMVESEQNGKVVVFEGAAAGQGQMSYACAHPTNFANAQKAYEYVNYLMNLMKSNNQMYHFTHYLTEFAL